MIGLALALLWLPAFIGIAVYFVGKRQLARGGLALFVFSLVPTIYGRSTTPEEWHDYPMMGLFYLPTILGVLVAMLLIVAGLFRWSKTHLSRKIGSQ